MPVGQESAYFAGLGVKVTRADLQPVLHLLEADVGGLSPRFLGPLGFIELELAVVHDATHGRVGEWRHLDEVEVHLPGNRQRIRQGFYPELGAVGVNEADFTGTDPLVDPVLVSGGGSGDRTSLLA